MCLIVVVSSFCLSLILSCSYPECRDSIESLTCPSYKPSQTGNSRPFLATVKPRRSRRPHGPHGPLKILRSLSSSMCVLWRGGAEWQSKGSPRQAHFLAEASRPQGPDRRPRPQEEEEEEEGPDVSPTHLQNLGASVSLRCVPPSPRP